MRKRKYLGRITLEEKILLTLNYNQGYEDRYLAPEVITQTGLGKKWGVRQTNISRALTEMEARGVVHHGSARIKESGRKMRTYQLTAEGERSARDLISELRESVALVETGGDPEEWKVSRLVEYYITRSGGDISDLISDHLDDGRFNLRSMISGYTRPIGQMSPVVKDFHGREEEMEDLERWSGSGRINLISVIGIPGVGKTSMAARFAQYVWKGPHLWFNADQFLSVEGILERTAQTLASLGRDRLFNMISGKDGRDQRKLLEAALSEMEKASLLMVVEDVHKAGEGLTDLIEMMTAVSGRARLSTLILITSRTRPSVYNRADLAMEGSRVVEMILAGLSRDAVSEMLDSGKWDPDELYRLTGGHPLAVRLVSMGSRDSLSGMKTLQDFIDDEILAKLPSHQIKVLKMASLLTLPADESMFLAIEGITHEDVLLLSSRMLLREYGDGKLDMHDLLTEMIRDKLSSEEIRLYSGIAADHYTKLGSDEDTVQLLQFQRLSGDREGLVNTLVRHGVNLIEGGYMFVKEIALSLDLDGLDPETSSGVQMILTHAAIVEGDETAAKKSLARAAVLCAESLKEEKTGERLKLAVTILARYTQLKGTEPVPDFAKGMEYLRRSGETEEELVINLRLAESLIGLGQTDEARLRMKRAEELIRSAEDPPLSRYHYIMGLISESERKLGEALGEYLRCISSEAEDSDVKTRVRWRTGMLYKTVREPSEAFIHLSRALDSALSRGDLETCSRAVDGIASMGSHVGRKGARKIDKGVRDSGGSGFHKRAHLRGYTKYDISAFRAKASMLSSLMRGARRRKNDVSSFLSMASKRSPEVFFGMLREVGEPLRYLGTDSVNMVFERAVDQARIYDNRRLDALLEILWGFLIKDDPDLSIEHLDRGRKLAKKSGYEEAALKATDLIGGM